MYNVVRGCNSDVPTGLTRMFLNAQERILTLSRSLKRNKILKKTMVTNMNGDFLRFLQLFFICNNYLIDGTVQ